MVTTYPRNIRSRMNRLWMNMYWENSGWIDSQKGNDETFKEQQEMYETLYGHGRTQDVFKDK